MKKKNLITLISLLLVTAFVLAACGGGETETPAAEPLVPEETAVAEPSDEETGEETADETELTLTVWVDEKQFDVIDGMVDEFKNEYGVTIIIEQLGFGDLQTQFLIAAPAGDGPDVMATAHNTLGEIVSNGLVAPIELGNSEADYTPASIQAWKYNGELYGLPYSTENVGFFINQDIVPGCPATWTEVMEISQEISADNDDDLETNKYGFVRMESDPYHFFPIMTAFGGYVFGMTDQGYDPSDVGLDSEETLAAAAFWDDYIKQGLQPAGVDNTNMMDIFESGQSAMTITGPWFTQRVKDSGINYAICPIPGKVSEFGQPFMGSFGFVISAFSENPLLAEIFVKEFLNSEETMRALYDATPQVPAHLAVLETLDDVDLVAYGKAGLSAVPMPAIPEMGSVW